MDERASGKDGPAVVPYVVLLRAFGEGRLAGDELEAVFLRMYKLDPTRWSPPVFDALDGFFADVDDFCADPALRARVGGLDEEGLRHRARAVVHRLGEITS